MTDRTTLHVRVGEAAKQEEDQRLVEAVEAMERGDDVESRHVLVLDDHDSLQQLFRPTTLELLEVIRQEQPESMRAVADLVDRDFKEVHRNLEELETLNVIEFESAGRAKRPVVKYDEIDFQMSLTEPDSESAPA